MQGSKAEYQEDEPSKQHCPSKKEEHKIMDSDWQDPVKKARKNAEPRFSQYHVRKDKV